MNQSEQKVAWLWSVNSAKKITATGDFGMVTIQQFIRTTRVYVCVCTHGCVLCVFVFLLFFFVFIKNQATVGNAPQKVPAVEYSKTTVLFQRLVDFHFFALCFSFIVFLHLFGYLGHLEYLYFDNWFVLPDRRVCFLIFRHLRVRIFVRLIVGTPRRSLNNFDIGIWNLTIDINRIGCRNCTNLKGRVHGQIFYTKYRIQKFANFFLCLLINRVIYLEPKTIFFSFRFFVNANENV